MSALGIGTTAARLRPAARPPAPLHGCLSLRGKMVPEELEKEIQRAKAEVKTGWGDTGGTPVGWRCWGRVVYEGLNCPPPNVPCSIPMSSVPS